MVVALLDSGEKLVPIGPDLIERGAEISADSEDGAIDEVAAIFSERDLHSLRDRLKRRQSQGRVFRLLLTG